MPWSQGRGSKSDMGRLLTVKKLKVYFHILAGTVRAVDGVDFHIDQGETLGVVGESGCGKSVTAMALLKLIPMPPGELVGGKAEFEGSDLLQLDSQQIRAVRGNRISMIFQEPMTSLNPVYTIGNQIEEAIFLHQGLDSRRAGEKAVEMLDVVGIPDPRRRVNEYPHQLSGGMRQRVMIAMALSCNPALLIADEPTTALDVTTQAQILDLMRRLRAAHGSSVVLITHDMGVVSEIADRVLVMYAGRAVEQGSKSALFHNPLHPYTEALLRSIPVLGQSRLGRLDPIS